MRGAKNMDGLMKGKHAQKKFGAIGAMAPTPLSLKTPGRGGGGGAGGCRIQGPGPPPPPVFADSKLELLVECLDMYGLLNGPRIISVDATTVVPRFDRGMKNVANDDAHLVLPRKTMVHLRSLSAHVALSIGAFHLNQCLPNPIAAGCAAKHGPC